MRISSAGSVIKKLGKVPFASKFATLSLINLMLPSNNNDFSASSVFSAKGYPLKIALNWSSIVGSSLDILETTNQVSNPRIFFSIGSSSIPLGSFLS